MRERERERERVELVSEGEGAKRKKGGWEERKKILRKRDKGDQNDQRSANGEKERNEKKKR